ncbi:MAG: hypothetical protein CMP19_05060 [Rickettsiales bacterium]|nr:hypothetical protein [Rickettsiales bacterium]|tara:strand:+ start:31 stop:378 length:348 start_codon:yes stop_codon:yes gene_type:complete
MSEPKQTNVDDFVGELEAGIFKERLAIMLTEAALGAVMHNRKGKVNVSFDIARVNESGQVMISANLKNTKPTKRGTITEEVKSDTPMWVGKGGVITIEQPKEELSGQFTLIHSNN